MSDAAALASIPPQGLPYRVSWRASGVQAGAHRGRISGNGGLFRDLATLIENPDPRRLDLRASLRDPFEQLYVRRFEQKTAITVYALVDVSASMGFRGNMEKLQTAAAICGALAASARRIGDAFGMIGCGTRVEPELHFHATRSRAGETRMVSAITSFRAKAANADGLIEAAGLIAGRRKLVVLISDFHIGTERLEAIFAALGEHDIVPIQLVDSAETATLPAWGILTLTDLETGRKRLVALRPSLKAAWERTRAAHQAQLETLTARYARAPFKVVDHVNWDRLGAYLMGART